MITEPASVFQKTVPKNRGGNCIINARNRLGTVHRLVADYWILIQFWSRIHLFPELDNIPHTTDCLTMEFVSAATFHVVPWMQIDTIEFDTNDVHWTWISMNQDQNIENMFRNALRNWYYVRRIGIFFFHTCDVSYDHDLLLMSLACPISYSGLIWEFSINFEHHNEIQMMK
jgi:hypothetical protein